MTEELTAAELARRVRDRRAGKPQPKPIHPPESVHPDAARLDELARRFDQVEQHVRRTGEEMVAKARADRQAHLNQVERDRRKASAQERQQAAEMVASIRRGGVDSGLTVGEGVTTSDWDWYLHKRAVRREGGYYEDGPVVFWDPKAER